MATSFPRDVVEQAQDILGGWQQITPPLTAIGDLTPAMLEADLEQVQPLMIEIASREAQLTDMRNQRDDLLAGIWVKVKRVRSGVKGIYGDDSSAYEMVGGTRLSERRRPSRSTTPSSS